jgi:hypothetical protein
MITFHYCLARRLLTGVFVLALSATTGVAQTPSSTTPNLERGLETEIASFLEADRRSPPVPCQVLFVGSSSIVKWRDTVAADMAPMPVINRGFGGSQIEDVNRWFDQVVTPCRPRAIVFYAGENDIDAGKSLNRVVGDFDSFLARKTKALGATPVWVLLLQCCAA